MSSPSSTALEAVLARAGRHPRFLAGGAQPGVDAGRLAANLAAVELELDAPRPGWLARLLRRSGVSDATVPLVTATPGLRRSWLAAVVVALVFALNAASTSAGEGTDRIVIFLTIAPLVPLLGVALAFGKSVDPTHEIVLAAPMDGFRVFLVRAATVLGASTTILLIASLLVPEGGLARVAWLLPALATTATASALATRFEPRVAAGAVAASWVMIVVVVTQAADAAAMFGPATQVLSLVITAAAGVVFALGRRRLDTLDPLLTPGRSDPRGDAAP